MKNKEIHLIIIRRKRSCYYFERRLKDNLIFDCSRHNDNVCLTNIETFIIKMLPSEVQQQRQRMKTFNNFQLYQTLFLGTSPSSCNKYIREEHKSQSATTVAR